MLWQLKKAKVCKITVKTFKLHYNNPTPRLPLLDEFRYHITRQQECWFPNLFPRLNLLQKILHAHKTLTNKPALTHIQNMGKGSQKDYQNEKMHVKGKTRTTHENLHPLPLFTLNSMYDRGFL